MFIFYPVALLGNDSKFIHTKIFYNEGLAVK